MNFLSYHIYKQVSHTHRQTHKHSNATPPHRFLSPLAMYNEAKLQNITTSTNETATPSCENSKIKEKNQFVTHKIWDGTLTNLHVYKHYPLRNLLLSLLKNSQYYIIVSFIYTFESNFPYLWPPRTDLFSQKTYSLTLEKDKHQWPDISFLFFQSLSMPQLNKASSLQVVWIRSYFFKRQKLC